MKIIFLTTLLLISTNIFAKDRLTCAKDVQSFNKINTSYEDKYNKEIIFPTGLFIYEDKFIGQATLTFYVEMNQTFSLFIGAGNALYKHSRIEICAFKDRTFVYVYDENEYYEYYMINGNLMMAENNFEDDYPEEEPQFDIFRAGKVIIK